MQAQSDKILELGLQTIKLTSGEEIIGDCFFVDEEKRKGLIYVRVPLRIIEKISSNGEIENIFLMPYTNQKSNFDVSDNITINMASIITMGIPHEMAKQAWKNNQKTMQGDLSKNNDTRVVLNEVEE